MPPMPLGLRAGRAYPAECASGNSETEASSTPGKVPEGSGERTWACSRALGQACPAQRVARSDGARRQHDSSGQQDVARTVVSRPRNPFASANGTPTVIENSEASVCPVWVAHQYVPAGVSVYW